MRGWYSDPRWIENWHVVLLCSLLLCPPQRSPWTLILLDSFNSPGQSEFPLSWTYDLGYVT